MFTGTTTFKDHMVFFDQGIRFKDSERTMPYFNLMVIDTKIHTNYMTQCTEVTPEQAIYLRLCADPGLTDGQEGGITDPYFEVEIKGQRDWSGDREIDGGFSNSRMRKYTTKEFDDLKATSVIGIQAVAPDQREGETNEDVADNYRLIFSGLGVMIIEATDPIDMVLYQFKNWQWVKLTMEADPASPSGYAVKLWWQEASKAVKWPSS